VGGEGPPRGSFDQGSSGGTVNRRLEAIAAFHFDQQPKALQQDLAAIDAAYIGDLRGLIAFP